MLGEVRAIVWSVGTSFKPLLGAMCLVFEGHMLRLMFGICMILYVSIQFITILYISYSWFWLMLVGSAMVDVAQPYLEWRFSSIEHSLQTVNVCKPGMFLVEVATSIFWHGIMMHGTRKWHFSFMLSSFNGIGMDWKHSMCWGIPEGSWG